MSDGVARDTCGISDFGENIYPLKSLFKILWHFRGPNFAGKDTNIQFLSSFASRYLLIPQVVGYHQSITGKGTTKNI